MPYVPIPFPAWWYHATEPARVVQDEAEAMALGEGWFPSPGAVLQAPVERVRMLDEREVLLAEAAARGVEVDRRWGVARLRAELSKGAVL